MFLFPNSTFGGLTVSHIIIPKHYEMSANNFFIKSFEWYEIYIYMRIREEYDDNLFPKCFRIFHLRNKIDWIVNNHKGLTKFILQAVKMIVNSLCEDEKRVFEKPPIMNLNGNLTRNGSWSFNNFSMRLN